MTHRPASCALEHILPLLVVAALVGGCSGRDDATAPDAALDAVTGSITYRERIALTAAAVVEVELADVSVTDGPAEIVSTQRIQNPGQVPVHFKLEFPADRIDATRRYTVQARIREGERLAFATDTAYPVITEGNPRVVEVVVIPIGGGVSQDSSGGNVPQPETTVAGTLVIGGTTATYTARFEGETLTSLQEDRDLGVQGKAGAEYQFKEGRLLRYIELGTTTTSAGKRPLEFDFAFDDTGELLAARKTLNDTAMKPDAAEIDAARNRAELLRNHALALKTSRDHAH